MKKMLIVLMLGVAIMMVPISASATLYMDRAAWEAAVGGTFLAVDLPGAPGANLAAYTSISLPYGGFFNINVPLTRYDVGTDWATWNPYGPWELVRTTTPDGGGNYYANGAFYPNGLFTPAAPISAFGFEMEPWNFGQFTINLYTASGMISQSVEGDSGAKFFGWADVDVISFSTWCTTSSGGYAMGRFVQGGTPVPEPATMLLLGSGLLGLAGFRRKFKK
jgi:hypothetical protein